MTKCDICGKEFQDGRGLVGHKRMVHNDLTPRVHLPEVSAKLTQLSDKIDEVLKVQDQMTGELADVLQQVGNELPHLLEGLGESVVRVQSPVGDSPSSPGNTEGQKLSWEWLVLLSASAGLGGFFLAKRMDAQSP